MDKKLVSYIGLSIGIVLIFLGGGLLYLKEKSVKKTVVKNPKKVEVVISTSAMKTQKIVVPVAKSNSTELKKVANLPAGRQERKIAFRYRSSKPKSVFLVGDFNKWNKKANPMKQGQNFVWETILMLNNGEYKYAFVVDGKRINDPNNRKTVHLKGGKASVLKVEPLP